MKVLLINGSPHEKGCTYTALTLIAGELNSAGIETEILNVGTKPVGGCIGCGGCAAGKGCAVMQELGRNMAWLLRCFEAGRAAGIDHPENPRRPMTNFIR